jgi:hypothetical protein
VQVLAELAAWQEAAGLECAACAWEAQQHATPQPQHEQQQQQQHEQQQQQQQHQRQAWEALLPALKEFVFLDAGANTRGAAYPSPAVVQALGRRCSSHRVQLALHGTPRQWRDPQRSWLAAEAAATAAAAHAVGVPCSVTEHFGGQPPSLEQHFAVVEAFEA